MSGTVDQPAARQTWKTNMKFKINLYNCKYYFKVYLKYVATENIPGLQEINYSKLENNGHS